MARQSETFADLYKSVKVRYLQGRYRQCVTTCDTALKSDYYENIPLRHAFLYFYAALSYEALARSMHNRSMALETTLDNAEQCFAAAEQALPMPQATSPINGTFSPNLNHFFDEPFVTAPSVTSSNRRSIASFDSALSQRTNLSCDTAASSVDYHHCLEMCDTAEDCNGGTYWLATHHQQQYDDGVLAFRDMLRNHIRILQSLRQQKLSKRDEEPGATVGFAPYMHPGFKMNIEKGGWQKPKMTTDEKMERIRKGRETGWRRERFAAARYERLCNQALLELHTATSA